MPAARSNSRALSKAQREVAGMRAVTRSQARASPAAREQLTYYWSLSLQLRSRAARSSARRQAVDVVETTSNEMVSFINEYTTKKLICMLGG